MGEARVIKADRSQLRWDMIDLDGLLPADHRARVVWRFVEDLDLSALYAAIRSRGERAGRPAADPAVLLALWLYATVEGVGSARELERLAERDVAYRWLAGGVPVNYHGLADFRVGLVETLDRLLTESVTALLAEGLVSLSDIAVDGTKVRASASKGSFKRAARAQRHRKDEAKKKEPSVSLTDPEARAMRFADGAVRAGYNAQIAAAPQSGVIVSIAMTDRRNDRRLAMPMVDDIARRYGRTPDRLLVDTGYATQADIVVLDHHRAGPVEVFAPLPVERDDIKPASRARRERRRAQEPECVKRWRERMASEAGKAVYALRKQIERVNADRKNHGFGFIPVRGLLKARAIALWHALAHNLVAAHRLRAATA